jgi:beta-lactamase superfamily II metal-dependent hydrolase
MNAPRRRARAAAVLCALAALIAVPGIAAPATAKLLKIYFIDVEGGQSTLVVTPDRHSLLIDTGFAGDGQGFKPGNPHEARDANRIVAAARDAGITQIDYLLITHFHPDHDGGVSELSQLMPIRGFIDHGVPNPETLTSAEIKEAFDAYVAVRSTGQHLEPVPGDHLPLKGLDIVVVSSAGSTLSAPLPGAGSTNTACPVSGPPATDPYENPRSTGILLRYGKFRFLDVGDLTGKPLFDLACPKSLIGPVDVYLVAHHGGLDAAVGETIAAFQPRIAVMNNGTTKGGALVTYQALHHVPGLEDVWQLHASKYAGDSNFPAPFIANLDEGSAYWIELIANEDGSFRVHNPRTGEWKNYKSRPRS